MKKESYVYIICHSRNGKNTGPVKIGLASNPVNRVKELSTGNPNKIELFHSVFMPCRDTAKLIEAVFLEACASHEKRRNGEWVSLSPQKARGVLYQCIKIYLQHIGADEEKIKNILSDITSLGMQSKERKYG